jgi:hypothetical protein
MATAVPTTTQDQTTTEQPELDQSVIDALAKQGEKVDELTDEQRARAVEAPTKKKALRGKALVGYILTGNGTREQAQKDTAKSAGGKSAAKAKPAKADKYGPGIQAAADRANVLLRSGKDGNEHVPSPVTHEKVRAILTAALKKDGKSVTSASVLALSGVKSQKLLREIASWQAPRSELKPLREVATTVNAPKALSWAHGRYLAAILAVWIDDLKK